VAISNNRLMDIEGGKMTFRWKDYRHHGQQKIMTLDAEEFIRRFLLHLLPEGFQRIRHYGFLSHRYRQAKLALCRPLLGAPTPLPQLDPPLDYRDRYEQLTGRSLRDCPACHRGHMVRLQTLLASWRASPLRRIFPTDESRDLLLTICA
jgi:hypothetical protein